MKTIKIVKGFFPDFFLKYARQLSQSEEHFIEEKPNAISKKPPTLDQFKEQIDYFEDLHKEVKELEGTKLFNNWLRVDVTPLRVTILTNIKQWSYLFKKHLLDTVSEKLTNLNTFIEKAEEGMMIQLIPGDYEALIKVMGILKGIRDRQNKTDEMFDPLGNILKMLRQYGMIIPENIVVFMEELPEKWANTKRLSVSARQEVVPLEGVEKSKLKINVPSGLFIESTSRFL